MDPGRTTLILMATVGNFAAVSTLPHDARAESGPNSPSCRCLQSGPWTIRPSKNFRVCTLSAALKLDDVPSLCETLRDRLRATWVADDSSSSEWQPRCDVIVHATWEDYRQALGSGVGRSVGCATWRCDRGCVVSRRIDLRADADGWRRDALPHELTHLVLADRVRDRRLAPWLDEGLGVLSESIDKRRIRGDAFEAAQRRRATYSAADLLQLSHFPRQELHDAFYAQSASYVRLLADRKGPEAFGRFLDLTIDRGADVALREVYDLAGTAELERTVGDVGVSRLLIDRGSLDDVRGDSTAGAQRRSP